MVSLRKPGKFSLHKNTHLFPDLFNNTALPPTFSGALIIVNNSAYWLFYFTIHSLYSQYNLRKKFTKRILLIQRSHSNCSLLLIFVLTRARAYGGCRARACVAVPKRKLALCCLNQRAHIGTFWQEIFRCEMVWLDKDVLAYFWIYLVTIFTVEILHPRRGAQYVNLRCYSVDPT